jgi:hypothetical protein
MFGRDDSVESFGLAPMSIYWLFQLMDEQCIKHGNKFCIKISAVEIWGKEEKFKDLLDDNRASVEEAAAEARPLLLNSLVERKAFNAQKAVYYLDLALNSRSSLSLFCCVFIPKIDQVIIKAFSSY